MKFVFVFLFIVSACAHVTESKYLCLDDLLALKPLSVKKITPKNSEAVRQYILNELQFQKLTFKQSHEPYFGKVQWSNDCLSENKVGALIESQNSLSAMSELYVDENLSYGFCSSQPGKQLINLIFVYCSEKNELIVLKILKTKMAQAVVSEVFCKKL